jgi:hypothetical protein
METEVIVAPVSGTIDAAGTALGQGDVRLEESGVAHPAFVAGHDGAQVVVIVGDRRALRSAVAARQVGGALGDALPSILDDLEGQLAVRAAS